METVPDTAGDTFLCPRAWRPRFSTMTNASRITGLILIVLATCPSARAQTPPTEQSEATSLAEAETFSETVQVNVVNIEVFAADKRGRPVTDLAVEDFELFEDGRRMEITNFSRVINRRRLGDEASGAATATGELADRPQPAVSSLEPADLPEDERLHLVVYLDNVSLRPLERKRVMQELKSFLFNHVRPEDRVMVASYDRSLKIRQPFTSDSSLVLQALDEASEVRGEGNQFDAERRRLISAFDRFTSSSQALMEIRPFADSVQDTVSRSIDSLRDLIEGLAGLPGRKTVLYVSSGLPMVAAADLFGAVQERFESSAAMSDLFNYDASRRFDELSANANAHGITFNTLDAGGLRPDMAGAAENPGIGNDRVSSFLYRDHQANLQDPLFLMADETGGRAILNRNEILPALDEIGEDFNTYYSLGYSPGHFGTGRQYTVEVKVKRKGVRPRYRRSYRDKSDMTLMDEQVRAALRHGVENNLWHLELQFGPPEQRRDGKFVVPVQIRIPVQELVLVPQGESHQVSVLMFLAAMDAQGDLSAVEVTPLGLRIANENVEAARSETWLYTHRLLMGEGRQSLAIALRDQFSGSSSLITRSVTIGR